MKDNERKSRVCPLCGQRYTEPPALSRIDNEALICPDCGTRQALDCLGVDEEEREEIIRILHGFRPT